MNRGIEQDKIIQQIKRLALISGLMLFFSIFYIPYLLLVSDKGMLPFVLGFLLLPEIISITWIIKKVIDLNPNPMKSTPYVPLAASLGLVSIFILIFYPRVEPSLSGTYSLLIDGSVFLCLFFVLCLYAVVIDRRKNLEQNK